MSQSGILNISGGGGGGSPIETITGNDGVATTPLANNVNMLGLTVANATNAIPVYVKHTAAATDSIEVQVSEAVGSSNINNAGLSSFNSAQFSVDVNGYVSSLSALTDLHVARFIVASSTSGTGANYTSVSAAITAAVATGLHSTIFIQPGTYSEGFLSLPANINLCAFECDALTPNVTLAAAITCTDAGSRSISGINLQTIGSFALEVSGSAATVVYLRDCYFDGAAFSIIGFSSSSAAALIDISNCSGNLTTNTLFNHGSAGTLNINNTILLGTGTTAASVNTTGTLNMFNCVFPSSMSASVGTTVSCQNVQFTSLGTTAVTIFGGTCNLKFCTINAGTFSAVNIVTGATLTMAFCDVTSSNTNAITGLGTLKYAFISFSGSSSTVNTSTQTALATLI